MGRFSKLEWEPDKKKSKKDSKILPQNVKSKDEESFAEDNEVYDYYHYVKRAEDFFYVGEFKKSLRDYSRALQMDNSQIDPWTGQVMCLISMNQTKEADLWIARGLELFPDHPNLLSLRGLVYAQKGMLKRAIATSDYALTVKSVTTPLIWILRGEILLLADSKNASFCFDKALELANQADWQTPMLIGIICYRNKYYTQASQFFQKACSINLSHYYLWYHLGLSYQQLGFTQKAIEAYKRSLEIKQDFKEGANALYHITHKSILKSLYSLPLLPFRLIKKFFISHKINNI